MKPSLSILFWGFFFLSFAIFSEEEIKAVEDLTQLVQDQGMYFLIPLERFDGKSPYGLKGSDSYLRQLQFVSKVPSSPGYQKESEAFSEKLGEIETLSLQVYSHLEIPEREKIRIVPKEKKFLPIGIPILAVLWVHSDIYEGQIRLILKHPREGRKSILLGDLRHKGWKRLSASIPIPKKVPRLQVQRKEFYQLEEIVLEFGKSQRKGTVSLYLDRLIILMEKINPDYPGSEMEDGWKLK